MTNGNDAAYARTQGNVHGSPMSDDQSGLTKREYFAAMAMQGLLSRGIGITDTDKICITNAQAVGNLAVLHANALIEALNEVV